MRIIIINVFTLAALSLTDIVSFKIPNVILVGWLGTLVFLKLLSFNGIILKITIHIMIGIIVVTGSYISLSRIVKCSAGDFKLYFVLAFGLGLENMMIVLFISACISLFPLLCGIKKIPMAIMTYFGYIAFLLMKSEGLL